MSLEMNDLLALKSMGEGMSPYETFKVGHMQSKRPSGAATAGLVLGSVGTALAVGAWISAQSSQRLALPRLVKPPTPQRKLQTPITTVLPLWLLPIPTTLTLR